MKDGIYWAFEGKTGDWVFVKIAGGTAYVITSWKIYTGAGFRLGPEIQFPKGDR